jgi:2-polyprenyl-6-methoxyphenol hydroxylase-like FAD-dependent oxidoreductase
MRSITIVGAGQAGLQLGIGLLKKGYHVTLVSNKTAKEVLDGYITSTQGMFDIALQHERDLGLNFYYHCRQWK